MCNQLLYALLQMLKVMCFWFNKIAAKLSQIRLSLTGLIACPNVITVNDNIVILNKMKECLLIN